jgi:hypothetical protein
MTAKNEPSAGRGDAIDRSTEYARNDVKEPGQADASVDTSKQYIEDRAVHDVYVWPDEQGNSGLNDVDPASIILDALLTAGSWSLAQVRSSWL